MIFGRQCADVLPGGRIARVDLGMGPFGIGSGGFVQRLRRRRTSVTLAGVRVFFPSS